ncbi:UNVERIFIED_CONTAM: protein TONNEAU 1a [Sesamum radiatum]|uniref:Protein TONNEAU 1a n=1 Tax=Sesamum radiatum TaxID=300843 RepID=A0AAW2V9R8_SESRA
MDDYTREMMDLKTLAELRASVFEAIEEEDKVIEKEEGLPPALLGSCNERAKQLHNSPSGRLLNALICEYLDWAQLNHTLKVYLPESNLNLTQGRGSNRRSTTPEPESLPNVEARNIRRPSPSSVAGGLPPLGRPLPVSQSSDRRAGSSTSGYRKDEYNWRYDNDELPEDLVRASAALENLQLDRKARHLTTSWRFVSES